MMDSVIDILNRYSPLNTWVLDNSGPKWPGTNTPRYVIDRATKEKYLNENNIRLKHLISALCIPFLYPIMLVICVVGCIFKVLIGYHFWKKDPDDLKTRAVSCGKDCLKILISPLIIPCLELSVLWGIISPYDGRKVFSNIEKDFFGTAFMACFHPDPKNHLFGGKTDDPNAW